MRTPLPILLLTLAACGEGHAFPHLEEAHGSLTAAGTEATVLNPAAELQVSARGGAVSLDGVLPRAACGRTLQPRYRRGDGVLVFELGWGPPEESPVPCANVTFTALFKAVPAGSYTMWFLAPAEAVQAAQPTGSAVDSIRVGTVVVGG